MTTKLKHNINNMSGFCFTGKDVGTHLIRSSFSRTLHLSKRTVSNIILLGQWCSYHFLLYIRRQVQEFSAGISANMVSQEAFFTISYLEKHQQLDPCTRNSQSFVNTISLNGSQAATAHVKRPDTRVWR